MKKIITLCVSILLCMGAHAIDTTSKDYQKDLEKQLGYKLPKLKDGKYKPIENGHIPVYVKKQGIYFCDLRGNQVTEIYLKVANEKNGYYPVKGKNGWGMIDTNFKEVVPCKYTDISTTVVNGLLGVSVAKDRWNLVDLQGQTLIEGCVGNPSWNANLNCWICKGPEGWGIATPEGKVVVPMAYAGLYTYDGEVAIVAKTEGNMELFNCTTQNIVTTTIYSDCLIGKNGVVAMKEKSSEKWGVLNSEGVALTPFTFENATHVKPLLSEYANNPTTPLSEARFKQLSRFGNPKRNTYNIEDKIPSDIWNY